MDVEHNEKKIRGSFYLWVPYLFPLQITTVKSENKKKIIFEVFIMVHLCIVTNAFRTIVHSLHRAIQGCLDNK